ncbi:MAG: GTPase ObgE [Elusimicrobiota bacterium]
MFIDSAKIRVKAGNGGDGSCAFRREKFIPKGGPNGGDGGRGGDILIQADSHLRTLLDFIRKPKYEAQNGESGSSYHKFGLTGANLILKVPCGTSIYQQGSLLADLVKNGQELLVAKGGRGGRGNVHFKNSVRQTPRIAEKGEPGEDFELELHLKTIADVGLIGLPNAGKSTLLSRLTRANPKIANYPFTTLHPNLGVGVYHHREIIFADIPGLIEGSHAGKGLGHDFLKHIERTRILVHVIDPLGFSNKPAKESIGIINNELKSYSKILAKKPQLIVVNKQDLAEGEKVFKEIKKAHKKSKVLAVSGVTGLGIEQLLSETAKLIDEYPEPDFEIVQKPVHIKLEADFWVEKQKKVWFVKGKKVERIVQMTNFDLPEAVMRTQNILKKIGVERQLLAAGALNGDPVTIAGYHFNFEPGMGYQMMPPRMPPRR